MRRIIKPFAVERRRAGRRPAPSKTVDPVIEAPPSPEWPPVVHGEDEDSYAAAMRAADALFSRPEPTPQPDAPAAPAASSSEAPRRILPTLHEENVIDRLLAEEEARRPRRGRKPRGEDEPAPLAARAPALAAEEAPAANLVAASEPASIPGYVRGHIYARYARHSAPRPGEAWRRKSLRPLW
jgi:hypothetical protein